MLGAFHAVNVLGRSRVFSASAHSLGLCAEREDRKLVHTFTYKLKHLQIQLLVLCLRDDLSHPVILLCMNRIRQRW
jgi:hypothetical protein